MESQKAISCDQSIHTDSFILWLKSNMEAENEDF